MKSGNFSYIRNGSFQAHVDKKFLHFEVQNQLPKYWNLSFHHPVYSGNIFFARKLKTNLTFQRFFHTIEQKLIEKYISMNYKYIELNKSSKILKKWFCDQMKFWLNSIFYWDQNEMEGYIEEFGFCNSINICDYAIYWNYYYIESTYILYGSHENHSKTSTIRLKIYHLSYIFAYFHLRNIEEKNHPNLKQICLNWNLIEKAEWFHSWRTSFSFYFSFINAHSKAIFRFKIVLRYQKYF